MNSQITTLITAFFPVCLYHTSRFFSLNHKWEPHDGAKGEVRGAPAVGFILLGPWMTVHNVMAVSRQLVFQILWSGWTVTPNSGLLRFILCVNKLKSGHLNLATFKSKHWNTTLGYKQRAYLWTTRTDVIQLSGCWHFVVAISSVWVHWPFKNTFLLLL